MIMMRKTVHDRRPLVRHSRCVPPVTDGWRPRSEPAAEARAAGRGTANHAASIAQPRHTMIMINGPASVPAGGCPDRSTVPAVRAEVNGALAAHQSAGRLADEDRNLGNPAHARVVAGDMDHCIQRGGQLRVQCGPREPAKRSEGFQTSRDIGRGIGVDGATTTFVTGIHRCQQVDRSPPRVPHRPPAGPDASGVIDGPDQSG